MALIVCFCLWKCNSWWTCFGKIMIFCLEFSIQTVGSRSRILNYFIVWYFYHMPIVFCFSSIESIQICWWYREDRKGWQRQYLHIREIRRNYDLILRFSSLLYTSRPISIIIGGYIHCCSRQFFELYRWKSYSYFHRHLLLRIMKLILVSKQYLVLWGMTWFHI